MKMVSLKEMLNGVNNKLEDIDVQEEDNKKLNEDQKKEKNSKLIEDVTNLDKMRNRSVQIQDRLLALENLFPENSELQEYLKLLKEQEEINNQIDESKDIIYNNMNDLDVPELVIGNTLVTLSKPTIRRTIKVDNFCKDYGPNTKEYKKYVEETFKKGFIKIKDKKESKNRSK